MSGAARCSGPAIAPRWLCALPIVAAVAVGAWMTGLPNGILKLKLYNGHKWIGATVLAVPLLGWAYSSGAGYPLVWLDLVALAALQVAAALKHQFVDRDGLLAHMAPWRR